MNCHPGDCATRSLRWMVCSGVWWREICCVGRERDRSVPQKAERVSLKPSRSGREPRSVGHFLPVVKIGTGRGKRGALGSRWLCVRVGGHSRPTSPPGHSPSSFRSSSSSSKAGCPLTRTRFGISSYQTVMFWLVIL